MRCVVSILHCYSLQINARQLQEDRAEAAEQRQNDEARHVQEVEAITRQFQQQAEELRAEISANRIEQEDSMVVAGEAEEDTENERNTTGSSNNGDGGEDGRGSSVEDLDLSDDGSHRSLV